MNEMIVPVTPIMKLKAFNQATFMKNRSGNKIQQYGKDYTNSSEAQSFNNAIVGELGELAFRQYLADNNLYYTDDERELINKGHDYNSAIKKSDMGDFFCSKTQESIDLKTNHSLFGKNILIKKWVHEWRPIDYYVYLSVYPLNRYKSDFDLNKVTHVVIHGYVSAKEFMENGTQITEKGFGYPKYKLRPFSELFPRFYKKDELPIIKEQRIITLDEYSEMKEQENIYNIFFTDGIQSITNWDMKYFLNEQQKYDLSAYKSIKHYDRHKKIKINNRNIFCTVINKDNTIDVQMLVRALRRSSASVEIHGYKLVIPWYRLREVIDPYDLELVDYYLKDFSWIKIDIDN